MNKGDNPILHFDTNYGNGTGKWTWEITQFYTSTLIMVKERVNEHGRQSNFTLRDKL